MIILCKPEIKKENLYTAVDVRDSYVDGRVILNQAKTNETLMCGIYQSNDICCLKMVPVFYLTASSIT
jgi:hypothetical protein